MDNSTFRERAGVLAAYLIIAAYASIGFVQYAGAWFGAPDVTFDPGWTGSMNGLAGGALGYLIGKQTTNAPGSATVNVPVQVTATDPKQP